MRCGLNGVLMLRGSQNLAKNEQKMSNRLSPARSGRGPGAGAALRRVPHRPFDLGVVRALRKSERGAVEVGPCRRRSSAGGAICSLRFSHDDLSTTSDLRARGTSGLGAKWC
jgi:hypothetical protein